MNRGRQNLRPWKKGQSGNPRGSSKAARERATWRQWLESQEPEVREILLGIACGYMPESDGVKAIKRVPIGERRRAAEFLAMHLHGHPKQPVESEWPENVIIHVNPSDVGPGRKD